MNIKDELLLASDILNYFKKLNVKAEQAYYAIIIVLPIIIGKAAHNNEKKRIELHQNLIDCLETNKNKIDHEEKDFETLFDSIFRKNS